MMPGLFQLWHEPRQKPVLCREAQHIEISGNANLVEGLAGICETAIGQGMRAWSIVPWHFTQRSPISATTFTGFVDKSLSDGADCAFIDLQPGCEAMFANPWEHLERRGGLPPALLARLNETGLPMRSILDRNRMAISPCIGGNRDFWRSFLDYFQPLVMDVASRLRHGEGADLSAIAPDLERLLLPPLFSTMVAHASHMRFSTWEHPVESYVNLFGREWGRRLHAYSEKKARALCQGDALNIAWWQQQRMDAQADFLKLAHLEEVPSLELLVADGGFLATLRDENQDAASELQHEDRASLDAQPEKNRLLVTLESPVAGFANADWSPAMAEGLVAALPLTTRILAIACPDKLGALYRSRHPDACWTDTTVAGLASLPADELATAGLIVCCTLPPGEAGEGLLQRLAQATSPTVSLCICVHNLGYAPALLDALTGDYEHQCSTAASISSVTRSLLATGWLGALVHHGTFQPVPAAQWSSLMALSRQLRVPPRMAALRLSTPLLTFAARKLESAPASPPGGTPPSVSVIVASNNRSQLKKNILASPGLLKMEAELIIVEGAQSAADAFEAGRARANNEWLWFSHQDVYFPPDAADRFASAIARIPDRHRRHAVLGVVGIDGMNKDRSGAPHFSGTIADRYFAMQLAPSDDACGLDELLVILHRETPLRIDPTLGWHLWAADLCVQARETAPEMPPRVICMPVYHNSHSDSHLSPAYWDSVRRFFAKYPALEEVVTTCGTHHRSAFFPESTPATDRPDRTGEEND